MFSFTDPGVNKRWPHGSRFDVKGERNDWWDIVNEQTVIIITTFEIITMTYEQSCIRMNFNFQCIKLYIQYIFFSVIWMTFFVSNVRKKKTYNYKQSSRTCSDDTYNYLLGLHFFLNLRQKPSAARGSWHGWRSPGRRNISRWN